MIDGEEKVNEKIHVLIVDDEAGSRETLLDILEEEGYSAATAGEGKEALEMIGHDSFQIALVDIRLPGMDGVELLGKIREQSPETAIIMITADATLENSIKALNLGAYSYLTKPLNIDEVKVQIKRVVDNLRLSEERDGLLVETEKWASQLQVIGEMARSINASHDMRELLKVMYRELTKVIDYTGISIFLLDPGDNTIEEMTVDSGEARVRFIPAGKVLKNHAVGWVRRAREPLVTE